MLYYRAAAGKTQHTLTHGHSILVSGDWKS